MNSQNRTPRGNPAGGQFAATPRLEAEVGLPVTDLAAQQHQREAIAEAIRDGRWGEVPPLVDTLAETGWQPPCPDCGRTMSWERDMAEPDEQWLWCDSCSQSYTSDEFHRL